MADVVTSQPLNMPAGNGAKAEYYYDVNLGASDVSQVIVVFPAGCAGLVGARIEFSVNPVYPVEPNPWFIFDDFTLVIPVSNQGTSGQWRVVGYNQDYNQHTVGFYFYWDYLPVNAQQSTASLIAV